VFLNLNGTRVTLNIPEPLDDLDSEAIGLAMDQIIAADVIVSAGGSLVNKVRAVLVSREEDEIAAF